MKRLLSLAALCLLACSLSFAQQIINGARAFPATNSSTGTTLNSLAVVGTNGQATTATTSQTTSLVYVVVAGAGTSGTAALANYGVASCTMDASVSSASGDYIVASTTTAGDCHPQSSAPSNGTGIAGFLLDSSTTSSQTARIIVQPYLLAAGGGGSGSVTGVTTASPFTSQTITSTGTIAYPTNGVTNQILTQTNGSQPSFNSAGILGRTVSGATDTILCDSSTTTRDRAQSVLYQNAGATAVTLPQAGSSGCAANFYTFLIADAASGGVTITPTTSTISYCNGNACTDAASSLAITAGQTATIWTPDNTNYLATVQANPPATGTANCALLAPQSGATGTITCRSITASDLPDGANIAYLDQPAVFQQSIQAPSYTSPSGTPVTIYGTPVALSLCPSISSTSIGLCLESADNQFAESLFGGLYTPIMNSGYAQALGNMNTSQIATPIISSATAGSAGTLAAGTYYYEVTSWNGATGQPSYGETPASNEVSATTSGSSGSVALAWGGVEGASGYNVYCGSSSGGETFLAQITGSGTVTYTATTCSGVSATVAYDTSNNRDQSTSASSVPGVTLTLGGTNDVIVTGIADNTITAIASPTGATYSFDGSGSSQEAFGYALNTATGAAPTWSTANGTASISALAIDCAPLGCQFKLVQHVRATCTASSVTCVVGSSAGLNPVSAGDVVAGEMATRGVSFTLSGLTDTPGTTYVHCTNCAGSSTEGSTDIYYALSATGGSSGESVTFTRSSDTGSPTWQVDFYEFSVSGVPSTTAPPAVNTTAKNMFTQGSGGLLELRGNSLTVDKNNCSGGTTLYELVTIPTAGSGTSSCVSTITTSSTDTLGVAIQNAGTSGTVQVAVGPSKAPLCIDGTPTAGDYLIISTTTAGCAHDTGSNVRPTSGKVVGTVNDSNLVSGTNVYSVELDLGFGNVNSTLYSAAGTALPTCNSAINGTQAVVSDATSPTYMGTYTSGGGITTAVICSYNGSAYAWKTH